MTFPRTSSALKAALSEQGFRPSPKKKGQCFLTDPNAVDAIVRDAGVTEHDHVVEVGTGPGLLTHALCETGARLTTFDVDIDLQRIAQRLRDWPERVRFIPHDVLAGKHALSAPFVEALSEPVASPGRRLLVSNLPYSAATPILMGVLSLEQPPEDIVVMVQLEVAEKMLAHAGDSNYGAPSIQVGVKAAGRILRRVDRHVFWPRPKVTSALLRLVPVRPALVEQDEHLPFGAFVTALFTRRRKVLPTALRHAVPGLAADDARAALDLHGIAHTARAQEVPAATLLALWRDVRKA
ncbi:MAG: 16S rRNA (adenine(1518)-N(6)/adenine(1519)-N(6))-dimethyltransferase RsmA [Planctomycetota bacterium]|nr:16S rRNA (adenine(1518)-N(6)/adenine(1519)-N(6))-dimethyltransferase RsmA [Planctomycetota bacterium]